MEPQVVCQVQEIFMDFYPLSPTLFTLNEPCCAELEAPNWNQALFTRLSEGLISVSPHPDPCQSLLIQLPLPLDPIATPAPANLAPSPFPSLLPTPPIRSVAAMPASRFAPPSQRRPCGAAGAARDPQEPPHRVPALQPHRREARLRHRGAPLLLPFSLHMIQI